MSRRTLKPIAVTGTGASQLVVGPDVNRVGVIISTHADGVATVKFGSPLVSQNEGISTHQRGSPLILTKELVGDMITQSINCFATNTFVFNVTEIIES